MEQKKWRPQDYIGWSEGNDTSMAQAMKRAVDDIKEQIAIRKQQEEILGSSEEPINYSLQRRKMLMKEMGIEDNIPENYNEAETARQDAIKTLGWKTKNGVPEMSEGDEADLNGAMDRLDSNSSLNEREKLLLDAMTDWKEKY